MDFSAQEMADLAGHGSDKTNIIYRRKNKTAKMKLGGLLQKSFTGKMHRL